MQGDGNGDGVPDGSQANVVSAPIPVNPPATPAGSNFFYTLVADSREGRTDTQDSNQAEIRDFKVLDAPPPPPPALPPLGSNSNPLVQGNAISFKVEIGTAGLTETFSLFVPANLLGSSVPFGPSSNGFWIKDKAGVWNNIATRIEAVGNNNPQQLRIDFAITDGGAFDADGVANGRIDVLGAPGHMPLSVIGLMPDAVPAGFWF